MLGNGYALEFIGEAKHSRHLNPIGECGRLKHPTQIDN